MSQNESFIDEVSDEVRRDRLFALFRRWAWLAVLSIVVVVGLASWNEWRKARSTAAARAVGDAVAAALDASDATSRAAALGVIETAPEGQGLVDMLIAAESVGEDDPAAVAVLDAAAVREGAVPRWRDLAALKVVLIEAESMPPEERIGRLESLTAAGAPYRLLALEQTAYARAEMGETDAALAILSDIIADGEVTEGLRLRASQMIVALGGSLEPA